VHVSTLSGEVVSDLAMPRTSTAAQLKRALSQQDRARTPASRLCLLLGHEIVSDADVLDELVPVGSPGKLALHLVRKHRKVVRTAEPASGEQLLVKMLLLGDGGVGKSSVAQRFARDVFEPHYHRTVCFKFWDASLLVDDQTRVKLQFWDAAEDIWKIEPMVRSFTPEASCVLVFFDTTARSSFEHLPKWLGVAEEYARPGRRISIIGTKADLVDECTVSEEEAAAFAATRGLTYHGLSAKTGANVEAYFYDKCSALVDLMESARGY